ncbi:DUF2236 domain-containing protein [Kibdelosporangium philippinense]|uniref:DUF2236 domain-containing protein n=1 Tax=Kibdelosporangium philippinense TaxID=211113 RepID=A0ABS8Z4N2_9PSEU|nr:oxygenase MpaB family protein [Kibdelosporangium philippinense]MCE7001533.1 DUF2236 domain-containing protein [Kibdelosporangium philippinense]
MSVDDQRLPHPPQLSGFPIGAGLRLLAPGDAPATQQQLDQFRQFATQGDPLTDALVAWMRQTEDGRELFEHAIQHGVSATTPEPLRAFFASVEEVPYWLDRDLLTLGSKVVRRTGLWGMLLVLPFLSLAGGYLASRADKTLVGTGNLDQMAPRRLAETAKWWVDVTDEGGLARSATGFHNTLRVRVMHAHVRAAMNRRRDWDYSTWDHPVNQVQTVGTLMLFSLGLLVGSQAIGLRFTKRERHSVYHLWRYVGWLLGVDPRLLPSDEVDNWRLFWLEAATEFFPDNDSRRLAQALFNGSAETILGPWMRRDGLVFRVSSHALVRFQTSYTRLVLGGHNGDQLGAPRSKPFQAAVIAAAAVNSVGETLRRVIPGANGLAVRIGTRSRRVMIDRIVAAHLADRTYTHHSIAAA